MLLPVPACHRACGGDSCTAAGTHPALSPWQQTGEAADPIGCHGSGGRGRLRQPPGPPSRSASSRLTDGKLFVGGRADGQGCHFSTRPTHPSGAIRFNLQAIRWQPVSAELGSVGEFYESGCCFQPTPVGGRRVSERPLPGEKGAPRPGQGHVGVLGLSSPGAERPLPPSDGSRRQEGGRGPPRSHGGVQLCG